MSGKKENERENVKIGITEDCFVWEKRKRGKVKILVKEDCFVWEVRKRKGKN